MQSEANMHIDVLIVGAGPTGLMLANQLARRGIRPIIIDRHSGPAQQTRAIGVQARTLEIYSKMGMIETALSLGMRTTGANMWTGARKAARLPLGDIGKSLSPFPYVLMLGQDDNERIMGDLLQIHGLKVRWQTELVALTQHETHATCEIRDASGRIETVNAQWVAGCDGSRSAVREMCGIGFPGAPYEHTFFVADTLATGPMVPGELNIYLWEGGFHLFFPMRGKDRWRVIGILPKELRQREGLTFDELSPSILREAGADVSFQSCLWFSTYRIHHRAAERFRDGRCFLLGDAAHIHSPAGAQGMNTGLQDAYNLGWKLALVAQGRASTTLLDTYEQERVPVARRLLQTTDRAFQIIVAEGWLGRVFRTRILARIAAMAMRLEPIRRLAFKTISQVGIAYPDSRLSQAADTMPGTSPRPGDRFPWLQLRFEPNGSTEDVFARLDDTCFNFIVIGQKAPPSETLTTFGDLLRVHTVPADELNTIELKRVGIPATSYFLIRPDGHIGLCGLDVGKAPLQEYARRQLGLHGADAPSRSATGSPKPAPLPPRTQRHAEDQPARIWQ